MFKDLTPVERYGRVFLKRDDLYQLADVPVCGGKVRAIYALAQGARYLVSFGSRYSPHVHRVAAVAAFLDIPCRLHIASGANTPSVQAAEDLRAQIIRYRAGYLSVLQARAREDAHASSSTLIPFGVVCQEAANQVSAQTANLPTDMQRLVIAVGSGITLAGILQGLREYCRATPVLGVCVGKDPTPILDTYAPIGWRHQVELVHSPLKFEEHAKKTQLADITLDPVYEAKCLPYLQPGDLLWVIGLRAGA